MDVMWSLRENQAGHLVRRLFESWYLTNLIPALTPVPRRYSSPLRAPNTLRY